MMRREATENAPDPDKSRSPQGVGLVEVIIAIFGYLGVSIAAAIALFALGHDFQAGGAVTILLFTTIAAVAPLAAVGIALLPRVRSLSAIGLERAPGKWLLIGVGFGLLGWAINRVVVVLYVWISGDASNPQAGLANTAIGGSFSQFALLVLLAGLLAPFGEELLFRGILFTWLRKWGFVLAVLLSSLVFGVAHGFNVVFPAAVVLGLLCAILYEKSGSIWPAVTAHAANNTLIFVTIRLASEFGLLDRV